MSPIKPDHSRATSSKASPVIHWMRRRAAGPITPLLLLAMVLWTGGRGAFADVIYRTNGTGTVFLDTATTTPAAPGAIILNYSEGAAPTSSDILAFNNFITTSSTFRVSGTNGTDLSVAGLAIGSFFGGQILNPAGAITIQNGPGTASPAAPVVNTLTIGASGIDMSLATQNLTISADTGVSGNNMITALSAAQTWSVRDGTTLAIATALNTGGNALTISGGISGGGAVMLTGPISGGGALNITGMSTTGAGNTVTISANNGAAGLGAVVIGGNATLNVDTGTTAGQSRLNDTASVTLNRGTLSLSTTTANQTEVVGSLALGQGLNVISRAANTARLDVNGTISRTGNGAVLNVGNIGNVAANSYLITDHLNTANGLFGAWAVAVNGTSDIHWIKNATNASDGAVIALSGADYTTNNSPNTWNTATQNIQMNSNGSSTMSANKTISTLRIAHTTPSTAVTVNTGTFTLTLNDGNNGGGIIRNQGAATTIGGTAGTGGLTAGGAGDNVNDTLYLWNMQNTMTVNAVIKDNNNGGANSDTLHLVTNGNNVTLTADNTFTGGITIGSGILAIGNNAAASDNADAGSGPIVNHGTLVLSKTIGSTIVQNSLSNDISGSGGFTLNRGTGQLNGNNTYYGNTTIGSSTGAWILQAGSTTAFSPNSLFVINNSGGAGIRLNGFNNSIAAIQSPQATALVDLGANTLTLTGNTPGIAGPELVEFQGLISGAGGGLTKAGAFTQLLNGTGALTYTGTTTVNGGVLQTDKVMATGSLVVNGTPGAPAVFVSNIAASIPATATVNLSGAGGVWRINNGFDHNIASLVGVAGSTVSIARGPTPTNLTVTDGGGVPATFAGAIQESGAGASGVSFTKAGSNTLVLSGGNNYSGPTTILGGQIQTAAGSLVQVIPDRSAVVLADAAGVSLNINGVSETIGSLAGGGAAGGNVSLGAGTLTTGLDNTSTTYGGVIGGTGGLAKIGNGTLTLTAAQAFTGPLLISNLGGQSGGGLVLAPGAALADAVAVRNTGFNTTFTVNNTDTMGAVTGTANTALNIGTGVTLTSTYVNGTPTALAATADSASANGRIVRQINTAGLKAGDLISGGGVNAPSYVVQVIDDTTVLVNLVPPAGPTNDFAPTVTSVNVLHSAITGAGNFTKDGAGLLILTGNNTLNGTMTITNGSVQAGGIWTGQKYSLHDTLSDTSRIVFDATNTTSLTFANNATSLFAFERVGSISGGAGAGTSVIINVASGGSNVLALGGDNSSSTFTGQFMGAGGDNTMLIKEGTGNFTWSNPTTNVFDGAVYIDKGTFTIAGAAGFDGSNEVYMSNAGTTLAVTTTGGDTIPFLHGGPGAARIITGLGTQPFGGLQGNYLTSVAPVVSLTTSLTVNEGTAANIFTFNGDFQGAGTLIKAGNHQFNLTGVSTNAFTGETQVGAGTLRLAPLSASAGVGAPGSGQAGTLSTATGLRLTGGVLDINSTAQTVRRFNALSTAGTVQLVNGSLTLDNQTTESVGTVFTGNLGAALSVNASAPATLTLTGNSSAFAGTLNVGTNAAVTLGSPANFGDTARISLNGTGTQLTMGVADTVGSLAGSGNAVLTNALTLQEARSGTVAAPAYSGATSGAGALILSNYGGLTLSGNNAHTGGITLSNGSSLHLAYGAGTDVVTGGGTLTMNGANVRVFSTSGAPAILDSYTTTNLNAGASHFGSWVNYTPDAPLVQSDGNGGLGLGNIVRAAGGMVNVDVSAASATNANSSGILGGWAVFDRSTWAVGNGGAAAISGLPLASFGANTFGAGVHSDVSGTVAGANTATVRFVSGSPSDLQGTVVLSTGGILNTVGAGAATISAALSSGDGELKIHQYNTLADLTLTNVAAGQTITTAGGGRTVITNNITGAGTTNIGFGFLQLGNAGTAGNVGTGAILNHGTLGVNRTDAISFAQVISGTGNIEQLGTGTTTLANANTFAGRVTVRAGTLEVTNNGGLGAAATAATNRWANLTSVNTGGALLLNVAAGGTITETLNLDGGTLDLRSTVATTLAAPVVLSSDSTIRVSNPGAAVSHLITGEVYALPGADLTMTNVGGATPSTVVFAPAAAAGARWEGTTINPGGRLQIGNSTRGWLGTGDVTNNGELIMNVSDGHYVLGNQMSGTGNFSTVRNTVYLSADNTYIGTTTVAAAAGASLRIGNDTYAGMHGTGAVILNGTTAGADLRYHLIADNTISNAITLNPGNSANNATLLRQGVGSITLTGTLNVGGTSAAGRAVLQTEGGGLLNFAGTLAGGSATNVMNIVNNGIFVFGGSASNSYHGVLSGGSVWVFQNTGTTTLLGVNTFDTGNSYVQKGTVVVGTGAVNTIADNNDMHLLRGATLTLAGNETIGDLYTERGSITNLGANTLTVDDNVNGAWFGTIAGAGGSVVLGEYRAAYGTNTATGTITFGTGTTAGSIQTPNLANAIGSFSTINLGATGNTGAGVIEYVGPGETFSKNMNLSGTTAAARITANGNGALVLSGNITNTGVGDKTLQLTGQTGGYFNAIKNIVSGVISQGANTLTLSVNPKVNDDDRFGITGRWALTNSGNNFSGTISVAQGMLEFGGNLGTGGAVATSQMGSLTATRSIDLGTNDANGRRYDMFGNGDAIGAAGANQGTNTLTPNSGSTGTIIFNSTNPATFTVPANITWTQSFSSTTNPGSGQIINDGAGAVVIQGNLTSGASGNRSWILDGSNSGANEIGGIISNGTGNTVSLIKEGSGRWMITNPGNTFTGNVTVNDGLLEISGPLGDGATVALNADGGDGLYSGTAKARLLVTDTIGALSGDVLTEAELGAGAVVTLTAGSSTMNGVITGGGGLTRTDNDTSNTRVTTMASRNTYDGVTTITSAGSNNRPNRIDVMHLADGGQASGIGDSSNAAANLVIAMGSNGGGLRWIGMTNQSTDRLFTIGSGATGSTAQIWADGQVVADFAPRIQFTNAGALAIGGTSAQNLTLRGGTLSENLFAPQINNGAAATSLSKVEGGMWVLTNANGYTGGTSITGGTLAITNGGGVGTGTVAINGGAGTGLQIRGGAGGVTMTNNFTNATSDGGIHVTGTGNNTISGSLTFNGTNASFRMNVDTGATLNMTNALTGGNPTNGGGLGSGNLIKFGGGALNLSGSNNYSTGNVIVAGGTLGLDYTTNDNSKLRDGGTLTLGWTGAGVITTLGVDDNVGGQTAIVGISGGRVNLAGGTTGHVETVASTAISQGGNALSRASGATVISLGALTDVAGGNLDVSAGGFALTDTANGTLGLLLPGSVTVGKTDWAVSGAQAALTSTPWVNATDTITQAGFTSGQIVKFSGATVPGGLTANVGYYVVNASPTDFQVSLTPGGSPINLTNDGTAATLDRPGFITALPGGSYAADGYGAGVHTDVVAFTALGADNTTATMRFNQAGGGTLDLGGFTLSSQSGGVLITPASGNVIIQNGFLRNNATTAGLEALNLHQHHAGAVQIDAVIQNNSGAQGLTKTGNGTLYLNALNTYTGTINLHGGEIRVGGTIAAPGTATNATLGGSMVGGGTGNSINMSAGTVLTFNSLNTGTANLGTIQGDGIIQTTNANTLGLLFDDDNGNFSGEIMIGANTAVQVGLNNNALGSNRGRTTFAGGSSLQINDSRNLGELITYARGVTVSTLPAAAATLSGKQTFNNTSPAGMVFDIPAPATVGTVGMNISGVIYGTGGLTKNGNGILQISANNFDAIYEGFTGLGATGTTGATFSGPLLINAGTLYVGGARALGAMGAGNETIIANGATIDLRGQALNYGDDSDPAREIIRVQGTGMGGTGGIRNTTGTGQISFLTLDGDTLLNTGGQVNASAFNINTYDTNLSNANGLTGAFTRNRPVISGGGNDLTVQGARIATDNFVIADPTFATPLDRLIIREGGSRFRHEIAAVVSANSISSANITGGIEIGYGGTTAADLIGTTAGTGSNVGARLLFENYFGTHHSVDVTMNGALAATAPGTPGGTYSRPGGSNYLQVAFATIPQGTTYFDGGFTVTGDASRNILVSDSIGNYSVAEQGNTTVAPVAKMVIGGVIQGDGGLTKVGFSETRLTANNTFTGDVNVLRFGTSAAPWGSYTHRINGVDYATNGLAEGWAEWGLTLNGPNGALSDVGTITLQRRGMITLDNTARLNATSGVAGANNDNRIANDAVINLQHGWLRINGGTTNNAEALGTVNVQMGTNIVDLYPADGAGTNMTLTINTLNRSTTGILRLANLDATSTFSTANAGESVRVAVGTINPAQIGGGGAANTTNRTIVTGVLGGNIPLGLDADLRILGFNNGNVTDLWNQQRNLQFLAGSHFMTYDGGFLRPLDDDEYFTAPNGILSPATPADQNVNLRDVITVVKESATINSLRFGALQDHDGSGGAIHSGTTLTNLVDHHAITLNLNGVLKINSGMISSAYFTAGNTSSADTFIQGGALGFNGQEAVINNQNGFYRLTDGTIQGGNLHIRSPITNATGLTKTGFQRVILTSANAYTGLTTVSEGILDLNHGRMALGVGGAGNGVVILGGAELRSNGGIVVGTPGAREDIYVGVLQGDQQVMRVETDVTVWNSNLVIDNVDVAGHPLFTPRVRTDNSATSIINGNIAGGNTPVTNDILHVDSRLVSFNSAGNNVFIIRGQFGDRLDAGGNAVPIPDPISALPTIPGTRTNENEVLRVNFGGGSAETNFILDRQYNAAGRLNLEQGMMIVNYDPANPGLDGSGFYTNTALSRIPGGDSVGTAFTLNGGTGQQGFTMGSGQIITNGAHGLFLNRVGQQFNMTNWATAGTGAKYIGGLNQSGSVTFGNGTGSITMGGAAAALYAMDGGTVVFNQRLTGSPGTAPGNFGFVTIGRGTVELRNSTAGASDSNFVLAGGTLFLNHTAATSVALVGNQNARFDGGTIISLASLGANTTENFATNDAADRVLNVNAGGTEIVARGNEVGRTMTINMGNPNGNNTSTNFTRNLGATLNLVEDGTSISGAGAAQITLNFNASSTAATKNQIIPWATFGTLARTATDFAMSDSGAGNDVRAFARPLDEYNNNVATWGANQDISEFGGTGFAGTLPAALTISSLRFDVNSDSVVNLGNGALTLAAPALAQSASGLLVSSGVGSANKTITGTTGAAITASGGRVELIMHHFGTGNLNINVPITGAGVDLVIAGPSTTNASTIGTTGAVVLGAAANTYDGQTFINGSVLSFSSAAQLGANPASGSAARITMGGGTLRYTGTGMASLQNRGITFNPSGGTIDVADGGGELYIADNIASNAQFRGDLIKVGAGTLTLEGNSGANAGFLGLIDVRQGTLRITSPNVNAGSTTNTVLGSTLSYADGTIFRQGTSFAIQLGNLNDTGEWSSDEWITFEGGNLVTVGTINTQTGNISTSGFPDPNNERPVNLNGVITINGATTFDVVPGQTLRLNNGNTLYTTGNGDIIKDGQGGMVLSTNNPDYTGNLIIRQGRLTGIGQADVFGTGYTAANGNKTITLGSDSRQGIAELTLTSEGTHGHTLEINHAVNVVYNPAQSKRVLFETFANGSNINWNGDVTMNDNLQVYINDAAENGGSQNYVNFFGSFKDGPVTSGNLVLTSDDTGGANDNTSGRPYNYLVLKNDNSLWTGDVRVNSQTSYDQDQTAILRLEHINALTAANDVDMGFNSMLQVGGGPRTIGALSTNGGVGPFIGGAAGGTMGAQANGSTEIIENAASTPGTLTIMQTTPAAVEVQWDAHFRDGTLNSQFVAPGVSTHLPSAALSLVKAGGGWATLTLDNAYTGTTAVNGGILQVGRVGVGDTGAAGVSGTRFTSVSGSTVAGTGVIQGDAVIGGDLKPGDEAGSLMGTLTVNGALTLSSTAIATFQTQRASYTAMNQVGYDNQNYGGWIAAVPTDPTYNHMLNDPVTTAQHDKILVTGGLTAGGRIVVANNGYNPAAGDVFNLFDWVGALSGSWNVGGVAGLYGGLLRTGAEAGTDLDLFALGGSYRWDVSQFNSHGILVVVEQGVPGVVPEPSRVMLLLLGLLGIFSRRRRAAK